MDGRAVPVNQQLAWNMPLEMAEELNDLVPFDAAGGDLEVKALEREPSIIERHFQLKISCRRGVWPRGKLHLGATHCLQEGPVVLGFRGCPFVVELVCSGSQLGIRLWLSRYQAVESPIQ